MKVVVVGSGAREHALADVLSRTAEIQVTPGNAGIPNSVAISAEELEADLFVIGPEAPLVDGLADRLRAQGKLVFGPGAEGAQIEDSKDFMKALLIRAGVPTARYVTVRSEADLPAAEAFIDQLGNIAVVKTDYLAAGKGVKECFSLDEAMDDVREKLQRGDVVIEQFLEGIEISFFSLCDGKKAIYMGDAQDYKKVYDGDEGPNTGGMGAYSPVAGFDCDWAVRHLAQPVVDELCRMGITYIGWLYFGLMQTKDGVYVLEINIRFGDPEAQVVLPRISPECDLAAILAEAASGELTSGIIFSNQAAVTVVMAAANYPGEPQRLDPISGFDKVRQQTQARIFYAGVHNADEPGFLMTYGGRVLSVSTLGDSVAAARAEAYRAVELISWRGEHHRTDIADGVI